MGKRHDDAVKSLEERLKENDRYFCVAREVPTYRPNDPKENRGKIGQQDLLAISKNSAGQIYVYSYEVKTSFKFKSAYKKAKKQAINFYRAMEAFPHVIPRFILYHTRTGFKRIHKKDC